MDEWMDEWMDARVDSTSIVRTGVDGGRRRRVSRRDDAVDADPERALGGERGGGVGWATILAPRGLTMRDVREGGTTSPTSAKGQMVGLINAASYLRVPLVVLNSIVIFVKVVFG